MKSSPTNLIPIKDYARKIKKAPVSVRKKCERATLPGAVKIGRDWLVPPNAPYPDNRKK